MEARSRFPDRAASSRKANVEIAIRLDRRQRDIARGSLQDGVRATAQRLQGIVGRRRFDA